MAREKSSDIRLLKLVNKKAAARDLTMGYVLYQSETVRTNTDVTYNITFLPIIKNSFETEEQENEQTPEQAAKPGEEPKNEDVKQPQLPTSAVHNGIESEFSSSNKLTAIVDLLTKTIKFPHINKFKLDQSYRGYGLGSFAMNELAVKLKSSFPDFAIEPVYFYFDRKRDDEDRDAFFSFMEKFGFWFSFDDENNNKGLLNMEKAEMFKSTVKKDTCVEIELAPFIRGVFRERDESRRELGRIRSEFKKNNTYMNRFQKDEAIKFLINVIVALCLIIVLILFI